MHGYRRRLLLVLTCITSAVVAAPTTAPAATVRDGTARFEVITPTLLRIELAQDRRFENRRTLTTGGRLKTAPRFTTSIRGNQRIIRTSRITLRWRRGATSLRGGNLRIRIGRRTLRPRGGANPSPLGGWRRSLDLVDGPVPLHEGV